jgi:glycerol-3-phosphate dehydrogenase subunit B
MQVTGAYAQDNHLQAVLTETGIGRAIHQAEMFVLATGGILGGGITARPLGYAKNEVVETALGLAIRAPLDRKEWFHQKFLEKVGHPIFMVGLTVNERFQPVDDIGSPSYENLLAIGGALADCDPVRERSLEGVAIVTGYCAGQRI